MARRKLAGRTLARSQALQLLFQSDALGRSIDDVLDGSYLISDGPLEEYALELAHGAGSKYAQLDKLIESASDNWSVSRMNAVDRSLLRQAVYEMLLVDEVDSSVAISEAVELAKAFGGEDSSRFVNGVLGNIARRQEAGEELLSTIEHEDSNRNIEG